MKRRLAWLGISGALVAYGLAGAVGGCGSDEAVINEEDAGDDAPPGSSGGTGTTDGAPGNDAGASDAASDAPSEAGDAGGDGGGVSNPGLVSCGSGAACTIDDDEFCCRRGDGGGDCQTANNQCQGQTVTRVRCDEPSDCNGEQRCCYAPIGGGGTRQTACQDNCGIGTITLCKTNADCAGFDGGCRTVTCPGNRVFSACNATQLCPAQ